MTYYPVWSPRVRLSADTLFKGQTQMIVKQSTTGRVSDTFLNDPELTIELEGNNAVYWVEFHIHAATISTVAGIRCQWATPTGSVGLKEAIGVGQGVVLDGTAGGLPRMGIHNIGTTTAYGTRNNDNGLQFSIIERGLVRMGSGPGTLALTWAQIAPTATETIVGAGSYMLVRRIV